MDFHYITDHNNMYHVHNNSDLFLLEMLINTGSINREILKYLTFVDIISLQRFPHPFHRLCKFIIRKLPDSLRSLEHYHTTYNPVKWFTLPIQPVGYSYIHAIEVSGIWKDQGWGDAKSSLTIIRSKKGDAESKIGEYQAKNIVSYIGPAPHEWGKFSLQFYPKRSIRAEGDEEISYQVWYRIGGSRQDYSIYVKDVCVKLLCFSDYFERPEDELIIIDDTKGNNFDRVNTLFGRNEYTRMQGEGSINLGQNTFASNITSDLNAQSSALHHRETSEVSVQRPEIFYVSDRIDGELRRNESCCRIS